MSQAAPPERPELPADLAEQVRRALAEDLGSGDLTAALVPAGQRALARITARDAAVLCGQAWVDEVFRQLDPAIRIDWLAAEGARLAAGTVVCELRGAARPLLTGERSALNFLQTLSATATAARRYADAVAGTRARILDTRKTLPGLRLAQKYAVRVGGAHNHRIGLFDAILVKENHIVAAGGIAAVVQAARRLSPGVLLEVEVETLAQAAEAFDAGADRLLLDNFPLARIAEAVHLRDARSPTTGLEASGGITLANLREVAETGVDFISIGDLTKNIQAVDLSMRFQFGG
ncbi:MAG: carboxylating nicotinate-nucleotide diphosphorylase [Gammaproteobacteria bacterium]|nr:carboxylating nicotinate-nucleotide diphosphorylase [Gammaproteobacteria bacterium]